MPAGALGAQRNGRADGVLVCPHDHALAVGDAEPLRVGGRELGELARLHELERRRRFDLGRDPDRAEMAEPQRAVRRRQLRQRFGAFIGFGRLREGGGSIAILPAHASPADLVEREARVDRDRREELIGCCRRREPAHDRSRRRSRHVRRVRPARRRGRARAGSRARRSPTSRGVSSPAARSRGAGVAGVRQDARSCRPSRRRTRRGRRRLRARGCPP